MSPEFNLDPPGPPAERAKAKAMSPEGQKDHDELFSRLLKPVEQNRITGLLLQRLKERKPQLQQMLEEMS
jgi:hypothetical protein